MCVSKSHLKEIIWCGVLYVLLGALSQLRAEFIPAGKLVHLARVLELPRRALVRDVPEPTQPGVGVEDPELIEIVIGAIVFQEQPTAFVIANLMEKKKTTYCLINIMAVVFERSRQGTPFVLNLSRLL